MYGTNGSTAHASCRRGRVRHEQQYSPRSASEGTCTARTAVQPTLPCVVCLFVCGTTRTSPMGAPRSSTSDRDVSTPQHTPSTYHLMSLNLRLYSFFQSSQRTFHAIGKFTAPCTTAKSRERPKNYWILAGLVQLFLRTRQFQFPRIQG